MKACIECKTNLSNEANFCSNCGSKQPIFLSCPHCSYQNENNSKFCQECAFPLVDGVVGYNANKIDSPNTNRPTSTPPIENIPAVTDSGITIEFPFSTSQSFDFAVAEAQKIPSFHQFGEGKKATYRVTIRRDEIESISSLIEQMKGWRRRSVYVDGEKVPWDSVFSHLWCFERKKASYKPPFYCFGYEEEWSLNPWGCVHSGLPFREGADWFTWGRWLNERGDWEFDKERIRHELQKNLFHYRFCPALKLELVEATIAALPSVVNPANNPNWKFVEAWQDSGRPALVKVTKDQWGFEDTKYLVGVEPNGRKAIEELARKVGLQLA